MIKSRQKYKSNYKNTENNEDRKYKSNSKKMENNN